MSQEQSRPHWSLPIEMPTPDDPARAKRVRAIRIAVWVVLAVALIVPVVQFQAKTMKNLRKAARFDEAHPGWTQAVADAGGPQRPKAHKGAIGRWRKAVRQFWQGENIYLASESGAGGGDSEGGSEDEQTPVRLHPNMPFVLILLTPFAYLPVLVMALTWNLAKLAVLAMTFLAAARLAGHCGRRIPDWVLGLGLLWCGTFIIGDIQHGNTNAFVLAAVVAHLWLFRRGRDLAAGAMLALAICLKMTPAIFVLYWLYQRSWKLLAGTLAALVLLAVIVPAAAVGPSRYAELTSTWLDNLIVPGLVKGAWYPVHINQSLPGVASRYFLDGPDGNIFWNPDDNPYSAQDEFGWITLATLSPAAAKMVVRAVQVLIVALAAWAIGWRKLPHDDGRRMLHWGIVVVALLLLNQRTWDHHAGVLLVADVAIWQALAFGRMGNKVRKVALALMLLAGALMVLGLGGVGEGLGRLLGKGEDQAERFADVLAAYGPTFWHFVLLLVTAVVLSVGMKRSDPPYAEQRQKLGDGG